MFTAETRRTQKKDINGVSLRSLRLCGEPFMDVDLERKLYYDGITLFNEHEFFDAHEVWEDIWHMAFGTKFEFYQGMIQCAVALEHYRRSNPRGVVSLF